MRASGDGTLAEDFAYCRWALSVHETDQKVQDMSHTAALKHCVDQARDSLAKQVVEEAARERIVSQENALVPRPAKTAEETPVGKLQIGERLVAALQRGTVEVAPSPR